MIGKRIGRLTAAACSLMLLAATQNAKAADAPLQLNAVIGETGLGSFLGKQEHVALSLGEKYVNETGGIQGRRVHFTYYDSQSNPQTAVQLLKQVLPSKPAAVFGSTLVAECNAMMPLLRNGPVDYCFSAGIHPEPGSYSFTAGVSTYDTYRALLRYFRMRGWTRIAILTSTDASGQEAERGIDETAKLQENTGITLVEHGHFNPGDVSVSAQIEHIKAANPQAFIAWTTGTALGTVFKGLIQAGLEVPVGTGYGNMIYAQMAAYADFLPKQLYFPGPEWSAQSDRLKLDPAVQAAQKAFFDTFKKDDLNPDVAPTLAWDPMMIIVSGLRKLGPDATAEQLRDYMIHLKGFAGVDGIYDFEASPQRGLGEHNVIVSRWNPERKVWDVVSEPTGTPLAQQ